MLSEEMTMHRPFSEKKTICWNILRSNPECFDTFRKLGSSWVPSDEPLE